MILNHVGAIGDIFQNAHFFPHEGDFMEIFRRMGHGMHQDVLTAVCSLLRGLQENLPPWELS
jgi:hypothetical protein